MQITTLDADTHVHYVAVIEFKDGVELKTASSQWNDIDLFISKWVDRPWHKICLYMKEGRLCAPFSAGSEVRS